MKSFKKLCSVLAALALISSSFGTMQAGADDVAYIDFLNNQGSYGIATNPEALNCEGTRVVANDGDEHGDYTKLTGSNVYVCEASSNGVPALIVDNVAAGRLLTIEADFIPDENTQYVYIQTYWSIQMTYKLDLTAYEPDVVKVGEWNHLKIVADVGALAKSNNSTTINTVKSSYFINGHQLTCFDKTGVNLTLAVMQERLAANVGSQFIRLRFDAMSSSTTTVALDNVAYKTSDGAEVINANMDYSFTPASTISASGEIKYGLAGRASADGSYVLTPSTDSGYIELRVPTGAKYIKTEFDFLPDSNFEILTVKSRNQHLTYDMIRLTTFATESNQWIKPNQWNHVCLVSTVNSFSIDDGSASVTTDCYVNGNYACSTTRTCVANAGSNEFSNGSGDGRTYFPFRFGDFKANSNQAFDNIKIETSNTKPSPNALTNLTASNASVVEPTRYNDGLITIPYGVELTPADLSTNGTTAVAFSDSTMATALASTDTLAKDNYVIVTDANGAVKYYTVSTGEPRNDTKLDINFDDEAQSGKTFTGSTGAFEVQKGVYELTSVKSEANDKSLKISTTDSATDVFATTPSMTTDYAYTKIDFDLMITGDDFDHFAIGTSQNAGIMEYLTYANGITENVWNHITLIVNNPDTAVTTGTNTDYAIKSSLYINGNLHKTMDTKARTSSAGVTPIRLISYATKASGDMSMYLDNVSMVQSDAEIDAPEVEYTYYIADYGEINDKKDVRAGFYYNIIASSVDKNFVITIDGTDFTIKNIGALDVATSLSYVFIGAKASGEIPSITNVVSGENTYVAR